MIVDSGPLHAYVDEGDGAHEASLELLESYPGPLLIPQLVTAEVSYLIETRLGWTAEVRFPDHSFALTHRHTPYLTMA